MERITTFYAIDVWRKAAPAARFAADAILVRFLDLTVAGERADSGRKFKSSALDYAA